MNTWYLHKAPHLDLGAVRNSGRRGRHGGYYGGADTKQKNRTHYHAAARSEADIHTSCEAASKRAIKTSYMLLGGHRGLAHVFQPSAAARSQHLAKVAEQLCRRTSC